MSKSDVELLNKNNVGDEAHSELLAAQAHIWNHAFSYINSMSLKCAIQLGIPDIIHNHGRAMTLSDLVNALPIDDKNKGLDCVYRLMRILTHAGFFIKTNKDINELDQENISYMLTSTSRLLLKDEPLSMIPYLQAQFDPILMGPWHYLSQWFQNGESSTTFAIAHGKPFFEYLEKEPKLNRVFNESMASDARLVISIVIENCKGVFEGLKSLVDLGGGTGTVAKFIANAFPQINCTVLDLPHVVEGCEGSKNLIYVGGDMFKFIPPADVILLESILHDWSDDYCIKILKKCKEAIPSKENGGKLIVIEIVMDHNRDHKSYETQLFLDMLMMVGVNGKERSQQEWAKIFSIAGFSDHNIIPILGLRCVIEVYP
ncbi:8-hydroxyquercetin 8-O-methyltransferase [Capsicum annuum]|nr:8-hydroxyquercetin 8-O-methyltransferase [Capsicum annuum]KAF3658436.1 8-hydroxyquercetin 8-O-methyltransferase [Capsicum annuum]